MQFTKYAVCVMCVGSVLMTAGAPASAQAQQPSQADLNAMMARLVQMQSLLARLQSPGTFALLVDREIMQGTTSEAIRKVQELLAIDPTLYPEGHVTGMFGPMTREALKRLQARYGLEQTGRLDAPTREVLNELDRESVREGVRNIHISQKVKSNIIEKLRQRFQGTIPTSTDPIDAGEDPVEEEPPAEEPVAECVPQGGFTEVVDYTGVVYGTDKVRQSLDVFVPKGVTCDLPLVLFMHGGGFKRGDKSQTAGVPLEEIAQRGYITASMNYRFWDGRLQNPPVPTILNDVKGAIRFLRANAETYNIDTTSVGLIGYSAGGYLASMAGTTGDEDSLEGDVGGNTSVSSEVSAVVVISGAISQPLLPTADKYAGEDDAAYLIIHGTEDRTVPVSGARELQVRLKEEGVDTTLLTAPLGHTPGVVYREFETEVLDFIDSELK